MTCTLRNAATLSRDDCAILVGALGLLLPVSVGLRLVGLRRVLALVEALVSVRRRNCAADDHRRPARTAWLVEIAARWCLPRPTCLAKALVVFSLLQRRGLPVELVIGVTKAQGPLEGHAWVQLSGATIGGDSRPASYAALVRISAVPLTATTIALSERKP